MQELFDRFKPPGRCRHRHKAALTCVDKAGMAPEAAKGGRRVYTAIPAVKKQKYSPHVFPLRNAAESQGFSGSTFETVYFTTREPLGESS